MHTTIKELLQLVCNEKLRYKQIGLPENTLAVRVSSGSVDYGFFIISCKYSISSGTTAENFTATLEIWKNQTTRLLDKGQKLPPLVCMSTTIAIFDNVKKCWCANYCDLNLTPLTINCTL